MYAIPYPRACTWNKKQRSCFHRARDGDGCPAQAAAAAADLPPGHGPGITAQPAALLLSRPGCAPLSICRPDPSGFFRRARLRRQRRAGQVLHVAQITALSVTVAGWIPAAKGFKRAVLSPVAFLNTPPYSPPVVQFDGGRCTRRAGSAPPRAQPSRPRRSRHPPRRADVVSRTCKGPDHFGREGRPEIFLLPVGE